MKHEPPRRLAAPGFLLACVLTVAGLALVALVGPPMSRAAGPTARRGADDPKLPDGMKQYPSAYYVIYTDLPADDVREITLRMTKMAEEYHDRTAGFSGVIRKQFPFYVFKHPADYYTAGGPPGSAGVFMSRGAANAADSDSRLMAIAMDRTPAAPTMKSGSSSGSSGSSGSKSGNDESPDTGGGTGAETWHVVQHEGFHQFAHAVIGGELPIWVNEGLAEYFGEGIFTGDGFVTGIVSPSRLARVQAKIRAKRLKSIKEMMLLSHEQWNAEMDFNNYDMAWSMVHFLAHGEDGKYQKAFGAFMNDIGRKRPWAEAWQANFGPADGFEKVWSEWWLSQPPDPTAEAYARATAGMLTSFLARAAGQKQAFADFPAFLAAAKAHELKFGKDDWLPPGLLDMATRGAQRRDGAAWTLEPSAAKVPQVVATLKDQTRVVGSYTLSGARVTKVAVDVDDLVPTIAKARALAAENDVKKKDQAKTLVRAALAKHPKSPAADEARKLMAELR